jgi:hypothetical protein
MGTLHRKYDPVHLKPHPDYLLVIEQLGSDARPLPGPWRYVR